MMRLTAAGSPCCASVAPAVLGFIGSLFADPRERSFAVLALRGWIDLSAEQAVERTLEDLAARGVAHLVVDCSQLRHIDYRMVPRLVAALGRFERRTGSYLLCGLSHYLRDLFRLAGCDAHLRAWGGGASALAQPTEGPVGGTAS